MKSNTPRQRHLTQLGGALVVAALGLSACGGSSATSGTATSSTTAGSGGQTTTSVPAGGTQVLPVTSDPITNAATAPTLKIDSVLVENNVDASGAATDDHLEIALSNTGTTDLSGVEIFYTITDPTAGTTEQYYTALPAGFAIPAAGSRTVHFDTSTGADHFPVNRYSLYYSSTNALDLTVEVSAQGAKVQTTTVHKDAGGAEVPD